jgi:very-short-patch-repair endonuclease
LKKYNLEFKWQTSATQWNKVKNIAREMRKQGTIAEKKLWKELRNHKIVNMKFRRHHAIGKYIVDFYCREIKLIVEVDGEIHEYQRDEDTLRQNYLEELEYNVMRFSNEEVISNTEKVMKEIEDFVRLKQKPL